MLFKLLFIIFIVFLTKLFIIRFNYKDYFNITISILFVLFSYLYIINRSRLLLIIVLILSLSLIIYSYFKEDFEDSSIIFINGNFNFKNMIKNNYSLLNLVKDLKKNNMLFINNDVCGLLIDNKLVFYSKNNLSNRPVTLIVDGKIYYKELLMIGKNKKWILNNINKNNYSLDDIFYAFYLNNKFYIIKK